MRHWPAAWALLVLAASQLRTGIPLAPLAITPEAWGRLAALAVLGLASRRAAVAWPCWLLAAAAASQVGAGLAHRLDARPPATAAGPWAPSAWVEAARTAVLRIRGRARRSSTGRWSVPATVLVAAARDAETTPAADPACPPGLPVLLRGEVAAPRSGGLVLAHLGVRPPGRAAVPGGFDAAAWLAGRGITATARVAREHPVRSLPGGGPVAALGGLRDRIQTRLRERLARGLPPREQAIAGGVLLGGGTAGDLRDPFARLGLAHLFALSGLHVGILAGLVLLALGPTGAGPGARLLLLGPLVAFYVVLVDLPGSVVRAGGLVLLALLGPVAGRRLDSLRLLGLLLWANVLWQPVALVDTGTRLSYLAAGGIVAGQRLIAPGLAALRPRTRALAAAVAVTLSAQIATLPEVAASFGYLPLAGPLANLVLVPVFGGAVSLLAGGLALDAVWPWAGQGVLAVAWLLLRSLEALTARAAAAGIGLELGLAAYGPWRLLGHGLLVALLAGALRARRPPIRLLAVPAYLALIGLAAWRPAAPAGPELWQFSVGQGDAALLRLPDGWTCLIDTGEAWRSGGGPLERDLLPFLRRRRVRRLDAVVLTHGHADHTGGRDALAAALPVARWYTGGTAEPGPGPRWRPAAGDTLHAAGGWSLVCLHPPAGGIPAGAAENDRSVALGLCRDGRLRGLWTGDLERAGERRLLPWLPPVPERGLDVLKAGHHGSDTSGSPALLERTRPRLVLISCGVANRHGHPSHGPYVARAETLAALRTDLQGTVHLRWDAGGGLAWQGQRRLPAASLDTP